MEVHLCGFCLRILICWQQKEGYHIEDEVEIPVFDDGDGLSQYRRIASATLPQSNDGMVYLPAAASFSHSDDEVCW